MGRDAVFSLCLLCNTRSAASYRLPRERLLEDQLITPYECYCMCATHIGGMATEFIVSAEVMDE